MKLTDALLPCPFCGGTDLEIANTHTSSFWVRCNGCEAEVSGKYFPTPGGKTRADRFSYSAEPNGTAFEASFDDLYPEYRKALQSAVAAWNRRAAPVAADAGAPSVGDFQPLAPAREAAIAASVEQKYGQTIRDAVAAAAQPDERAAFISDMATQKPEKPDHWSPCGQCERNIERAQDILEASATAPQADPIIAASETLRTAILADSRFAAGLAFGLANLARERGMGGSGSMLDAMRQDAETRAAPYQWRDTGPLETGDAQ